MKRKTVHQQFYSTVFLPLSVGSCFLFSVLLETKGHPAPVDERVRRKGDVGSLLAASPDTPAAELRGADISLANAVQTL